MLDHALTLRELLKWGGVLGGGLMTVGGFGMAALFLMAALGSDAPGGDSADFYIPLGVGVVGLAILIVALAFL